LLPTGRTIQTSDRVFQEAELFDSDRLWLLKKLGFCFLKLKDYENALKYFEEAAILQPDDLNIRAQIGIATSTSATTMKRCSNIRKSGSFNQITSGFSGRSLIVSSLQESLILLKNPTLKFFRNQKNLLPMTI